VRENVEDNRLINDTFLCTSHLVSAYIYVVSDLSREIVELLPWDLLEGTPRLSVLVLEVVQTQLKRSSGNDTLQKCLAFKILPLL